MVAEAFMRAGVLGRCVCVCVCACHAYVCVRLCLFSPMPLVCLFVSRVCLVCLLCLVPVCASVRLVRACVPGVFRGVSFV